MTLVEKAVLDRYRQKQIAQSLVQPELTSMVSIQGKIEDILGNTKLADAEKVELLRRAQSKFESLKETLHPAAVKDLGKPEEDAAPSAGPGDIMSTVTLPAQFGSKLSSFTRFLEAHPGLLDKNAQNEAVVEGRPIAGSNFDDLVRNLYVYKSSNNLTGVYDLTNALVKANISTSLVSNRRFINLLHPPPLKPQLIPPVASTSSTALHSEQSSTISRAKRAKSSERESGTPLKATSKHKHKKKPEEKGWHFPSASYLNPFSTTSHTNMPALEDDPAFSTPEEKQHGTGRHPPGKRPRILYLYR